jgi:hypothetical protein
VVVWHKARMANLRVNQVIKLQMSVEVDFVKICQEGKIDSNLLLLSQGEEVSGAHR